MCKSSPVKAWKKTSVRYKLRLLQLDQFRQDLNDEFRIMQNATFERLTAALAGSKVVKAPGIKKGDDLTTDAVAEYTGDDWFGVRMSDDALNEQIARAEDITRRAPQDSR